MTGWVESLLGTSIPAVCGRCGQPLGHGYRAGVCATCWGELRPHDGLACPRCARPDLVVPGPCLACRDTPPVWNAAAAFGPYDGVLRDLILLLKQGRHDELATPLGECLVAVCQTAGWPLPDLVVPAPMHWWRRLRRGFNQAELLSAVVARALGVPSRAILHRRRGPPQVGQRRRDRLRLSSRRFAVRRPLDGIILLVDDVLTTGATAAACTRALRAAGARVVHILTVARTPDPRSLA